VRLTDHQLVALFTELLGADRVLAFASLNSHLHDRIVQSLTPDSLPPACVIYPQTIDELSKVIALAYVQRLRVLPCGNATKLDWGGLVSRADVVVSTSLINQIVEHCVGDLTVKVQAGVNYQDLQAVLGKEGQFWAIDPPYGADATIGGILATGSAGSLRHRYNSVRDMCLGVEFVRSDGEVVKAGGRVVKNVAGYDLMKLLTGSYGTLGIVSSITFRLYPLPEFTQIVVATGAAEAIAQLQQKISTSVLTPTACDVLSASVIAKLDLGEGIGLAVQFSSLKISVLEQGDRLAVIAKELNLKVQIIEAVTDFWRSLENLLWQNELRHASSSTNHPVVCKLGILPSATVSIMQQCQQIFTQQSYLLQIHAGSGLGVLRIENGTSPQIAEQLAQVKRIAEAQSGFLSLLEAPQELKFNHQVLGNAWGYTGNARDLMVKIQQQFDPRGLLSPERLI